jgi:CDP-glucose 4,6-dehydratase
LIAQPAVKEATRGRDFWSRQRVFVTGGSGLVGSHLVHELLRRGADVTTLIRDRDPRTQLFRSGDAERVNAIDGRLEAVADVERALAESGASFVFHLGAQTIVEIGQRSPLLTFEANIRGTYNLLEASRRQRELISAIVVASSDKAYGPSDRPYKETDALRPTSPYDVSKAATDLLAYSYHATFDLPTATVRCGNIYGGGDLNWSRLVPGTIRSFFRGESPEIRSDGTFVRDYIYVSDVVDAYLLLAESVTRADVAGEAFNFASGAQITVLEMVESIARSMGGNLPPPLILNIAKHEIREQRLSTSKARSVLGWSPRVSLEAGLEKTISWYRSYLGSSS